jgi:type I restriction enzyme S subunit
VSWSLVEIGELVEKTSTWNPIASVGTDKFFYIDLSSVDKDKKEIDRNAVSEILSKNAPSRAKQIVNEGDVLVATVRPNLNGVARVQAEFNKATASTGYCVLRANTELLDSTYLFYWVQTVVFVSDMIAKATGANYPAISDKIIKESKIPLPYPENPEKSLKEQKRIAAILDKADGIRRKRKQAIQLADDFLRSVFLDMFGDPVTNPKGWEVKRIDDFVSIKNGYAFKSEYFKEGGEYILLTPGNFFEVGGYKDRGDKQKFYNGPVPDGFVLKEGDILIAMTEQAAGLLGSSLVVPSGKEFLHNQRLGLLEYHQKKVNPTYIEYLFNAVSVRKAIHLSATGLKVRHTSSKKIGDIEIGFPTYDLQTKFSEIVKRVVTSIEPMAIGIESSELLFKSLSQKAFKGEL